MFTGIVEERGEIVAVHAADQPESDRDGTLGDSAGPDSRSAGFTRLTVRGPRVVSDARRGDSIAVDGVCLTVVDRSGDTFTVDVMDETLRRSTIGQRAPGDRVNLERAVTAATRLGGHIVQGHVDGTGVVMGRNQRPAHEEVRIAVGTDLARYLAVKGSVAVDGISLTIVDVTDTESGGEFTVDIIPETRDVTTIGGRAAGDRVNIEVDVVAKYVERLLTAPRSAVPLRGESTVSPVPVDGDRTVSRSPIAGTTTVPGDQTDALPIRTGASS